MSFNLTALQRCNGVSSRNLSGIVPISGISDVHEAIETQSKVLGKITKQDANRAAEEPPKPNPKLVIRNDTPESITEYSSEEITVKGRDAPKPFLHFNDYQWPQEILEVMARNRYSNPTPIQCQTLPVALEGRDLIGIAQTGSGKTLGFILPMIVNLDAPSLGQIRAPLAVVMAPTRELAQQINSVARQFRSLRSVCVYGGAHKGDQLRAIADQNPVLIVATPGRLNDLIESGMLSMSDVKYLVLDEADRMLDMGFEPQIRRVVDKMRTKHQTLMWSATWPEEVRELAGEFLDDPIHITVGGTELRANPDIEQHIEVLDSSEKIGKLVDMLDVSSDSRRVKKTLIFAETKAAVDFIAKTLLRRGISVAAIHSDRSQQQREQILSNFRRNRIDVLVATNVAARGLDVDDIQTVINFDFPNSGSEDYIHRIGRTARAGKKGRAVTFFTENDCVHAQDLVNVLQDANQPVNPDLHRMIDLSRRTKGVKKSFRGQPSMARMMNKYNSFSGSRPAQQNRRLTRGDYFGYRTPTTRYGQGGRAINYDDDRINGGRNHGGRRQHHLDDEDSDRY